MNEKTKATMLKYRKAKREQIQIDVAKGTKAKVKAFAEQRGISMSALIMQLLDREMREAGFKYEPEEDAAALDEQARREAVERAKAENVKSIK